MKYKRENEIRWRPARIIGIDGKMEITKHRGTVREIAKAQY